MLFRSWRQGWSLDLVQLLERASQQWVEEFLRNDKPSSALCADLEELLRQRVSSLLLEEGCDQDLVLAVVGSEPQAWKRTLADVCDAKTRIQLLRSLREQGTLSQVQAVVQRAARLAEQGTLGRDVVSAAGIVDPALFERSSEGAMLQVVNQLTPIASGRANYAEQIGRAHV